MTAAVKSSYPSSAWPARAWLAMFGQAMIFPLVVAILWQLLPGLGLISSVVLPPFTTVLDSLAKLWASGDLASHLQVSVLRVVNGFSIGAVLGIGLGLAMGVSAAVERTFHPTFRAFCQVPTMAWLPLLMMAFGVGETLKIIIITKSVMVPICINTFEGVRGIPAKYLEVARVLRLRRATLVARLLVPAVFPTMFTGMRHGLSHAWVTLVGVELLASTEGIGYMMHWGRTIFQLDVVFVGVIFVGLIGLIMDSAMRLIERRLRGTASVVEVGTVDHRGHHFAPHISFAIPVLLLFVWWLSVEQGWVDRRLVPPLEKVLFAPFDPVVGKLVFEGLGASVWRNLQGALLGSLAGLLFGVLLGFSKTADRTLGPSFHMFRQIAMFAWIPVLTAWFGIGEAMRILFIAIAAFKPMVLNTQTGIANISPHYLEVSRAMRLSRWSMVRKVVLPAALPSILTGLQLAFIASWLATIGVETLVSFSIGVGAVLREGQEHFHMEVVIFGIFLIGSLGFFFNTCVTRVANRLLIWREAKS